MPKTKSVSLIIVIKLILDETIIHEPMFQSFKHSRSSFPDVILPGITKNQMFFIIYAQTFCEADVKESRNIINKRRLNDFASKSSAFHETFHCESSTPFDCSTFVP
nr:uncharacterized protein LOC107447657 [Parasteatoda tepidariorum]